MAHYSFLQTSMLGGMWSSSAQGRMADPAYKTALNECLNSYPTEEGAWLRRPGFRYLQHTHHGRVAVLRAFDWSVTQPYQMEFTDTHLRFFNGLDLVTVNDGDVFVSGISTSNPAKVAIAGAIPAGWANANTVIFSLENVPCGPQAVLCNRQFTIANLDAVNNTFTLQDPISGAGIDGATIGYVAGTNLDKVAKVFGITTPYSAAELDAIRIVADDTTVLVLHPNHQPRVLTTGVSPSPFALAAQDFQDGPWLDIQDPKVSTTTLTLSAATGTVTVTASAVAGLNSGAGFKATDVNRLIRFQGGPPLWVSANAYSKGDQVTGSDGNIYVAQGGMTGLDPTLDDGTHWTLSPAHVNWIWLKIATWVSPTVVTATVESDVRTAGSFATVQGNTNIRAINPGTPKLGAKLSQIDFSVFFAPGQDVIITNGAFTDGGGGDISGTYTVKGQWNDPDTDDISYLQFTGDGGQTAAWATVAGLSDNRTADYSPAVGQILAGDELTTTVWRLGLYSDTDGWPSCGTYHESRLCLAGPAKNRIDLSKSNAEGALDPTVHFSFSPTEPDGTTAGDSAVAAIATSRNQNIFFWLESIEYGLLAGAQAGEWLLRSSGSDDPISDDSIQMRNVTTYGCANVEPQFCTKTLAFVQRQGRRILDIANYPYGETAGWYADNLDHLSDALTAPGIAEMRYQQTPNWNLWMRDNDGGLVGSVFRHAAYGKDSFNGWHHHQHGGTRTFESISTGPSFDGLSDTLYAVTNQTDANAPDHNIRWVECLMPEFDSGADACAAFHVDGAAVPCCTALNGAAPSFTGITIYGLWHLNGQNIQPFIGGLDLGDYTVANGAISITFADTTKGHDAALFTLAYFEALGTCAVTGAVTGHTTTTAVVNTLQGDLEAYVASGASVDYRASGGIFLTDPGLPYVVGVQPSFSSTGGMQLFNRNATGDEVSETTEATIFGAGPAHTFCSLISRLHPNGNYYGVEDGASNRVVTCCVRVSDQTLLGSTGTAGAGFGSGQTTVACPFGMAPVVKGANNYLVTCGLVSANNESEVAVWNVDSGPMAFLELSYTTTHVATDVVARVCEGLRGRGDYYVLGTPFYIGNSTSPVGLYEGWAPHAALRLVCSLLPADIDATWTNIVACNGPGFDAADSNLLFFVQTNDAVTNQFYLVKVNRLSGAIMWKLALDNAHACDLTLCNINGTLQIFDDGAHTVITIDLAAGTKTTTAWNAGISRGTQLFDGARGSIVTIGSYSQSTGPIPTLIGVYFGGHASVTSRVLEIFTAPNLFSTQTTTDYNFYGAVGLTYTSDAQLLRPDFGPDAGAQTGPAFGKVRVVDKAAFAFVRSRGVSIGTDFAKLNARPFKTPGGTTIAAPALFTGTLPYKDCIINDSGTDSGSQICWRITRPYPCMVTAVGGKVRCDE